MGADIVIAVDLGSDRTPLLARQTKVARMPSQLRERLLNAVARRDRAPLSNGVDILPLPSLADTLLGAIDIMQQGIARRRLGDEPPQVLLAPRLGPFGPFEYHRAAPAIAEGRAVVAEMLPSIRAALTANIA
jgi:NTE family protein